MKNIRLCQTSSGIAIKTTDIGITNINSLFNATISTMINNRAIIFIKIVCRKIKPEILLIFLHFKSIIMHFRSFKTHFRPFITYFRLFKEQFGSFIMHFRSIITHFGSIKESIQKSVWEFSKKCVRLCYYLAIRKSLLVV